MNIPDKMWLLPSEAASLLALGDVLAGKVLARRCQISEDARLSVLANCEALRMAWAAGKLAVTQEEEDGSLRPLGAHLAEKWTFNPFGDCLTDRPAPAPPERKGDDTIRRLVFAGANMPLPSADDGMGRPRLNPRRSASGYFDGHGRPLAPVAVTFIETHSFADCFERSVEVVPAGTASKETAGGATTQAIGLAVDALWPAGMPSGVRNKARDNSIIEWCQNNGRAVPALSTIKHFFAKRRANSG